MKTIGHHEGWVLKQFATGDARLNDLTAVIFVFNAQIWGVGVDLKQLGLKLSDRVIRSARGNKCGVFGVLEQHFCIPVGEAILAFRKAVGVGGSPCFWVNRWASWARFNTVIVAFSHGLLLKIILLAIVFGMRVSECYSIKPSSKV